MGSKWQLCYTYKKCVKLKESIHSRQATENNFIAEAVKYHYMDVPINMPISNYHHSHPPNCFSQHIREYSCWPTMAHSVGFPCQKSRNPFFMNTHSFLPVHHQILSIQPPLISRIHPFLIESLAFFLFFFFCIVSWCIISCF